MGWVDGTGDAGVLARQFFVRAGPDALVWAMTLFGLPQTQRRLKPVDDSVPWQEVCGRFQAQTAEARAFNSTPSARQSASTISRTRASKPMRCAHPSFSRALLESPCRILTSAGRNRLGSGTAYSR